MAVSRFKNRSDTGVLPDIRESVFTLTKQPFRFPTTGTEISQGMDYTVSLDLAVVSSYAPEPSVNQYSEPESGQSFVFIC